MIYRLYSGAVLLAIIGLLGLFGCSDNTFSSSTTQVSEDAPASAYVPLNQGWRISYVQMEPEVAYYNIEVTDPVNISGHAGYVIRRTNTSTNQVTYNYRYAADNAVFESYSTADPGVRILDGPFAVGHSWNRYNTTVGGGTNDGDTDTTTSGDDPQLGSIPGDDYQTMSIVAIESVAAMDGHTYGNCIKVAWQIGEYAYNYYWYAAGIGLVKFESVTNALAADDSDVLTIMSDYADIQY
ncbi:MAG: hypothetical protein R3F48_17640 [Candidatus Zixiibacteriota bacterium]